MTSLNIIRFATGDRLHRKDTAERRSIKHEGKYCTAGGPNKVSCKNTSYTPAISMHAFPKDQSTRMIRTQFVRHHWADFVPMKFSAVCSKHFSPTCFERKVSLGGETDDILPHRSSVVDKYDMSAMERNERRERRERQQVRLMLFLMSVCTFIQCSRQNFAIGGCRGGWSPKH